MRHLLYRIAGAFLAVKVVSPCPEALAQDPPAMRTNVANEAAEPTGSFMGAPSQGSSPSPGMKKVRAPASSSGGGFYGLLDLRHTAREFYDANGDRLTSDPALHAKLRIGHKSYGESLDVSAVVGASKLPASQRSYQNRPEVTVDVYPIRGRTFNFLTYASASFPVKKEDLDPTEFADGDRYDRDYRRAIDATITTFGFAPNLKIDSNWSVGKINLMFGGDAWTRIYSKPLFIEETDGARQLGLVEQGSPDIQKPFEDRAMRYVHQESAGVSYTPAFWPKISGDIVGYFESRYLPRYQFEDQSQTWSYTYDPERVSFTRFRVSLDLSASMSFSNELYYFRNGFFSEDRINQESRYKNIVRLAVKL